MNEFMKVLKTSCQVKSEISSIVGQRKRNYVLTLIKCSHSAKVLKTSQFVWICIETLSSEEGMSGDGCIDEKNSQF